MKKLIGTVAVAALLASAAFAEINFGAWLRVLAAPVAGNGDDIVSGMTNSWGHGARPARINIDATSEDEKVGFSMGVYNDAYSGIGAGDNYVMWAKPWDFLKISLGRWDYTAFRGDLTFGSWAWIRPVNWLFDDEGLTFDQLGAKNGIQLELAPVEGLLIMWNLPIASGWNDAYKMFEGQDIAAKYTIGDIGTIKLGWGGNGGRLYPNKGTAAKWVAGEKSYGSYEEAMQAEATNPTYVKAVAASGDEEKYLGDINVGFDLTGIDNLFLTVGAKISIASEDYKTFHYAQADDDDDPRFGFIKIALGASYQITDNFKISANYGIQTWSKQDMGLFDMKFLPDHQFGVGIDVGLTDSLTLSADFRGLIHGDAKVDGTKVDLDNDPSFSFLVGLTYNLSSNGYVGIGFQGVTGGNGFAIGGNPLKASKSDSFCWAVPIAVSVAF